MSAKKVAPSTSSRENDRGRLDVPGDFGLARHSLRRAAPNQADADSGTDDRQSGTEAGTEQSRC